MSLNDAHMPERMATRCEERFCKPRCDTAADFYLPDYMGDVKRITMTKAYPMCAGYTQTDGGVCFSVVVGYKILYLDSENKLTEAEFTSDLEIDAACQADVLSALAKLDVASLQVRAAGPRKLSAKASVSAEICMQRELELPPDNLGDECEMKNKKIAIYSPVYLEPTEAEVEERIAFFEDVSAEDVEIVCTNARTDSVEYSHSEEGIAVSAEIVCECIMLIDGKYIKHTAPLKLVKTLECDELCNLDEIRLEIASVGVSLTNATRDEDMKLGASVNAKIVCEVSGRYEKSEERTVITDAFIPGYKSNICKKKLSYDELVLKNKIKGQISEEIALSELGIDKIDDVLYTDARFKTSSIRCEAEKLIVEGEISFSSLCVSDGAVSSVRHCVPISVCEKVATENAHTVTCSCHLKNTQYHFDRERMYYASDYELYVTGTQPRVEDAVISIERGERITEKECCVCIYFPSEGDTLFSVSKKYSVRQSEIAEKNAISCDVGLVGNEQGVLDYQNPVIIDKYSDM